MAKMDQDKVPEVRCTGCDRRVACIRVSDGTVYRPLAWSFPDPQKPLEGICAGCQAVAKVGINLIGDETAAPEGITRVAIASEPPPKPTINFAWAEPPAKP